MVNARAVVHEDKKTLKMLEKYENEYPVAYQLFGDDAEYMAKASRILSEKCDILDINMGCPAPNNSKVPVTLKMRLRMG